MITTQLPLANPKKKPKRKYQEAWEYLKEYKVIVVKPTLSATEATMRKYFKTYSKAIKKEKYLDETFRMKYPHSRLSFDANLTSGELKVKLALYDYSDSDF